MQFRPTRLSNLVRKRTVRGRRYEHGFAGLALPPGSTFTRSGTAQGLYGADYASAVYSSYATDTPRFERLSDGRVGLLIEGARTNLLTRFVPDANWTASLCSRGDAATTAPDGTSAGVALIEDSATGLRQLQSPNATITSGAAHTRSIYLKAGTRSWAHIYGSLGNTGVWVHLSGAGAIGTEQASVTSSRIRAIGGGWYRCEITFTSASTVDHIVVVPSTGDGFTSTAGVDGQTALYIWGGQIELGAFASSPIPTTSASVTRNAETCSRPVTLPSGGFTAVWDVVSASAIVSGTRQYVGEFAIDVSNRCALYINGADLKPTLLYTTAGATQASIVYDTAVAVAQRHRLALRIATDNIGLSVDGGAVSTDASATIWTGAATEYLGTSRGAGEHLFGHFLASNASPTVWRPPVSDADLQALSTLT